MLQLGTIRIVEPGDHDFECSECQMHTAYNTYALAFRRFIDLACETFMVRKSSDLEAVQSQHLPEGPAARQTGNVTAATRLCKGQ